MKKKLLTIACLAGILSVSVFSVQAEISQKALQSFRSVFAEATQVKWTEYPDYYFVSFKQNDMLVKASYDKEGTLLGTTRYYKELRLPLNILYKIKKAYPSKTIDIVTEISNTDGIVYFIQLKDDKGWTIIQADQSGNLEVSDKFKKAN
jgi:hypothetical protein